MNKKTKRIAITTSVIATSFAIVGTAFAATGMPHDIARRKNAHPTHVGDKARGLRERNATKGSNFVTNPHYVGNITSLSGADFVIQGHGHSKGQATSTTITYNVNTTPATVYMKNGKLDSLTDLAVGKMVMVAGTLDVSTNTITATGVNMIGRN